MDYLDANRRLWNARTPIHEKSQFYDVDGFLAGQSTLTTIDQESLGDVTGKSLLHLQCHFGLDTLSLARGGAKTTGIDLSDVAIATANRLKQQADLESEFICCDVYDTANHVQGPFDIVFSSWGTLVWLPDLARWSQMVSSVTKPGSLVVVNEFHPVIYMLDDHGQLKYEYFGRSDGYVEESTSTYTDGGSDMPAAREVTWNHGLAVCIESMLTGGFRLLSFREFDFSPYPCFANVVEDAPGEWVIDKYGRSLPYSYALRFLRE